MSPLRSTILSLATVATVASVTLLPTTASAGERGNEPQRTLASVRAATAKYHDVDVAIADGFEPTDHCVESPEGGMGFHYAHPGRLADGLVADEPEVLLYERDRSGRLRLVGVEYVLMDQDQDPTTVEQHELGGQPFAGVRGDGVVVPYHYPLHVWLWKHNPSGTFADFNPTVGC